MTMISLKTVKVLTISILYDGEYYLLLSQSLSLLCLTLLSKIGILSG